MVEAEVGPERFVGVKFNRDCRRDAFGEEGEGDFIFGCRSDVEEVGVEVAEIEDLVTRRVLLAGDDSLKANLCNEAADSAG